MTRVLALSIGPVQEFIAAARRTGDMQAGSDLLVEVARAAAKAVQAAGGDLVFPADPGEVGPNKVVAVMRPGADPTAAAAAARKAAQGVVDGKWQDLVRHAPALVYRRTTADNQVAHLLEFYAAWADADAYADARTEADRRLAGRKALRDFAQPLSEAGVPRSSLDPSRDCVTPDTAEGEVVADGVRVRSGEMLDAVSLIKRRMGRSSHGAAVPTTSDLAARGVSKALEANDPATAQRIGDLCGKSADLSEGDFYFAGRLKDAVADGAIDEAEATRLERAVARALRAGGVPEAPGYFAILVADGDHMGKRLSGITTVEGHRRFSASLAGFAKEAGPLVAQFNGHPVYCGGDDVLALLPAPRALGCAAALAQAFTAAVGGTLSAGIAIVHHLTPLQDSVQRARDAEKVAKESRNAFALALHTRGGEPHTTVGPWRAEEGHPLAGRPDVAAWQVWVDVMRSGSISRGFPYELRDLAREFLALGPTDALAHEAVRILRRKRESGAGAKAATQLVATAETMLRSITDPVKMEALAVMLITARFLAQFPAEGPDHG
jgi:CRISPR-associated protein Cmr2